MSKQANPTVVGGFVVGALALAVGGVLAFGQGNFLQEELEMVAYFQSSVSGLDVGAPVLFKGVKLGRVSSVRAVLTAEEDNILIPVTMTFAGKALNAADPASDLDRRDPVEFVEMLVSRGLRAELRSGSFVTGKLYVGLDFYPETDADFVGDGSLPELPTTETGLLRLKKSLEQLPIEEVIAKAIGALDAVEAFAKSGRLEQLVQNTDDVVANLDQFIAKADQRLGHVADTAVDTMEDIRALLAKLETEVTHVSEDLQQLLQGANSRLGPLADSATETLAETRHAVAGIDRFLGDDAAMLYRMAALLEELTAAARAIRTLAAYLERHPEAVLTGKGD